MSLFGGRSSSTSLSEQTVVDSRVTGVEGSVIASGGGSTTRVETIAAEPLRDVLATIVETDARRSGDLRALVEATTGSLQQSREQERAVVSEAVQAVSAQRAAETETLTNSIRQIAPWIVLAVFLWRRP